MGTPSAPGEPERVAFVLIDGVGDVTIPQLGGRTPLQAASLPHLDALAGAAVRRLSMSVLRACVAAGLEVLCAVDGCRG